MARVKWNTAGLKHITAYSNTEAWNDLRNDPKLVAHLEEMGAEWVGRLNTELRAAQAKRKQPVEDGYKYYVFTGGTRARLHIVPFTARAMAHEATHQSILKLMRVGDVSKAEGVPEELARRANESRRNG